MISRADNAVVPEAGPRVTVAEPADRRAVRVRVVQGAQESLVEGTAYAWTNTAVFVAWVDDQALQHRDWFTAADVQPG